MYYVSGLYSHFRVRHCKNLPKVLCFKKRLVSWYVSQRWSKENLVFSVRNSPKIIFVSLAIEHFPSLLPVMVHSATNILGKVWKLGWVIIVQCANYYLICLLSQCHPIPPSALTQSFNSYHLSFNWGRITSHLLLASGGSGLEWGTIWEYNCSLNWLLNNASVNAILHPLLTHFIMKISLFSIISLSHNL